MRKKTTATSERRCCDAHTDMRRRHRAPAGVEVRSRSRRGGHHHALAQSLLGLDGHSGPDNRRIDNRLPAHRAAVAQNGRSDDDGPRFDRHLPAQPHRADQMRLGRNPAVCAGPGFRLWRRRRQAIVRTRRVFQSHAALRREYPPRTPDHRPSRPRPCPASATPPLGTGRPTRQSVRATRLAAPRPGLRARTRRKCGQSPGTGVGVIESA